MAFRLVVRPATPLDTQTASSLIHATMGGLADYLFGAGDPKRAVRVIGELFAQAQNRFSHQFADVVVEDGRATGILLSYPGRIMNRLNRSMAKQIWGIYGALGFVDFVRRSLPLASLREANADEYFINTLAVRPDSQGKGIGTHLLFHTEGKARSMHYAKCALTVDERNLRARLLYERLGYQVVEVMSPRWSGRPDMHTRYCRMMKTL